MSCQLDMGCQLNIGFQLRMGGQLSMNWRKRLRRRKYIYRVFAASGSDHHQTGDLRISRVVILLIPRNRYLYSPLGRIYISGLSQVLGRCIVVTDLGR